MARQPSSRIPPHGLHAHTGYWLDRLRSLVHGSFEAALAGQNVSVAQWAVLVTLYRGDAATPHDVAEFIDVDAGALTRLIDRVEAKGLVCRVPVPGDRRSLRLELTEQARSLTPQLAALADENDKAFFGVLSDHEHRTFRRLLAKLLHSRGVDTPTAWKATGSD